MRNLDSVYADLDATNSDDATAHLSAMLDLIYSYRVTFARASSALTQALALKTIPKSRRPFIEKQADILASVARGQWRDAYVQRDTSAFKGIDRYVEGTAGPDLATGNVGDVSVLLRAGIIEAHKEIHAMRALAGFESEVLAAHTFTRIPERLKSAVETAIRDFAPILAGEKVELGDAQVALRAVGAPVGLTVGGYTSSASAWATTWTR